MSNAMARRPILLGGFGLLVLLASWVAVGAFVQPRTLADLRTDYEVAKFAREHPTLSRVFGREENVQAAEVFARDFEALEDANALTAPIRVVTTKISHEKYESLVNPSDREKLEKEWRERDKAEQERREAEERELREREKEKAKEEANP